MLPSELSSLLMFGRDTEQTGQWWRWDLPKDTPYGYGTTTVTALVSWARPCHGFRLLHDAGGGRLVDHSIDAVMLPLLPPGPGLNVRNARHAPAVLSVPVCFGKLPPAERYSGTVPR